MSNYPVIFYEFRNGRYTPLARLQRNDGVPRDAWGNPKPYIVDSPSPVGDEVVVTKPGDPNEGREGPIWNVIIDGSSKEGEEKETVEVWFEDGIQGYGWDDLEYTGDSIDISNFPEIRPNSPGTTAPTTTCDEIYYEHPYHIRRHSR